MQYTFLKCNTHFYEVQFLLKPEIHDCNLKSTWDPPTPPPPPPRPHPHPNSSCPWSAPPRGLAQRSVSNQPMRAYALEPLERQVCRFWEVTKPAWQNKRKSNFLTGDTLLTIISPSDPQIRCRFGPRHVPTDTVSIQLSLHLTVSSWHARCQRIHN